MVGHININCVFIRRLSVLRESFRVSRMNSLRFDIPLMGLTATATVSVRDDVIKTLLMSKETKVVLTSFFRPNLRFSVSLLSAAGLHQ